MDIKRINGVRQWGATTTIQALISGYESMGITAIHVVPTQGLAWWNRSVFGKKPVSYFEFTRMLRAPNFKDIDVILFDDYSLMPNTDGEPLALLKWLEDGNRPTPRTVFVFSNND